MTCAFPKLIQWLFARLHSLTVAGAAWAWLDDIQRTHFPVSPKTLNAFFWHLTTTEL
jgi:hypothetical protein